MSASTDSESRHTSKSKAAKLRNANATTRTPSSRMKKKPVDLNDSTQKRDKAKVNKLTLTPETRYRMIEESAYFRALNRGFQSSDPVTNWLEAEAEINEQLAKKEVAAS